MFFNPMSQVPGMTPHGSFLIPTVIEKSNAGERAFDIFSRLHKERIIMVWGPVEDHMAGVISAQILHLAAEDPKRDINLYINSPGGSVTAGLTIYNTMKLVSCDVATWNLGLCASMGFFLLSGGTKGKRFVLPFSSTMGHRVSAGAGGHIADMETQMYETRRLDDLLMREIAKNCGHTVEKVLEDMNRDMWLTPEEVVAWGAADKVITFDDQISEGPSDFRGGAIGH